MKQLTNAEKEMTQIIARLHVNSVLISRDGDVMDEKMMMMMLKEELAFLCIKHVIVDNNVVFVIFFILFA